MKKVVLSVTSILVLTFVIFLFLGTILTNRYFNESYNKLLVLSDDNENKADSTRISSFPLAIRKYLESSIADFSKSAKFVEIELKSELKTDNDSPFLFFPSNQYYCISKPAYVLDGTIQTNELIHIRSIETFIAGKGNILNKFMSSITISDAKGSQINRNGLTRYLIESVFYPNMLFENKNITINESNNLYAEFYIELDTLKAAAKFHFNDRDEIGMITTNHKFRTTKLGYTKYLHATHFFDYKFFGNFKVPTRIEHQWVSDDSAFTYQRSVVSNITFHR